MNTIKYLITALLAVSGTPVCAMEKSCPCTKGPQRSQSRSPDRNEMAEIGRIRRVKTENGDMLYTRIVRFYKIDSSGKKHYHRESEILCIKSAQGTESCWVMSDDPNAKKRLSIREASAKESKEIEDIEEEYITQELSAINRPESEGLSLSQPLPQSDFSEEDCSAPGSPTIPILVMREKKEKEEKSSDKLR